MITQMTSLIRVSDVDTNFKYTIHAYLTKSNCLMFHVSSFVRLLTILQVHRLYSLYCGKALETGSSIPALESGTYCGVLFLDALDDDFKQTKDKHMSKLA